MFDLEFLDQYDGLDVIYCIGFTHGYMKVGTTMRAKDRIEEILSFGLLDDLVDYVAIQECGKKNPYSAESRLIDFCSEKYGQKNKSGEVFSKASFDSIISLMRESIDGAEEKESLDNARLSDSDFASIPGIMENLEGMAEWSAAGVMAWHAAIALVCSFESSDAEDWNFFIDNCPPFLLKKVDEVMSANALLIGQGYEREQRKERLIAAASSHKRIG